MTPKLQNTIRFVRTLGVFLTLLAMLSISLTQVGFEECSRKSVSQELELVLVRRVVRRTDDSESAANQRVPLCRDLQAAKPLRNRFFSASTERAEMNGTGTHLLI